MIDHICTDSMKCLVALELAYESNNRVGMVKTKDGQRLTSVLIDETETVDDPSVERICGEDGKGQKVAFDIRYNDDNSVQQIEVLVGSEFRTYGELDELIVG